MKILVTGANGYIGQGLVRQLLDDGHEVVATDFRVEHIDPRAERKATDLFGLDEPYEFFGEPDACFHLAWRNGFVHNDPSHIEDLPKHYAFLEKLIKSGIRQMTVMGSMHEIGFFEGSIKPDTPCNPQSLYGISKNALRQAIELLCKNSETVFQWVRGYYIVGNSEYGSSIFSKITAAEKRGDSEFPFTMGQNQWDFIDYDRFCDMLAAVIEQTEHKGIINACSGFPEKLSERVERFIRENQYSIRLKYGAFPDRPYDSKAVWGDDTIIRRIMEKREAK
ncbi:NAD-dependent epimerase/dehydratase family protein [Oribacterium sp. WCC10]|uniref:NAD-dependent epimerase/dehydratase family protein n=1 Tax=Oribacterium sp. WCC10 TaxID=1855343 RepID=UPI0008EF6AC2|nr:NAD-dependent epimerase/dehydratase family protein [Oribacterium sp. WCC10]SFG40313.1 dTDP-6-deoxy-L-talose 4-dehydrogenase (NAD+) [Oribacterium sp. WCC10]